MFSFFALSKFSTLYNYLLSVNSLSNGGDYDGDIKRVGESNYSSFTSFNSFNTPFSTFSYELFSLFLLSAVYSSTFFIGRTYLFNNFLLFRHI